jgi:hypothetical protein
MFRKRTLSGAALIAASCLAMAAPAAQARPVGLAPGSQPGTWKAIPTTTTSQPVLSEPIQVATPTSTNGFNWSDAAIGAAAAAGLIGVAGIAGGRVRPRRAATS